MQSSHLTSIVAHERIAEWHRAAATPRHVKATRDTRRHETAAPAAFVRRLRRRLTAAQPAAR